MPTHPELQFLGAAQTVTGSRFLLQYGGVRLLIDCGLFQGVKSLRQRNWARLPVDPASIDAVVLTHAHIDHSGYLPRLCDAGFRGKVYCTSGTADLLEILLPDAGHLQEDEARYANRRGSSKHKPALPLYTVESAKASLEHLHPVRFGREFEPAPGVKASFSRAGHITGSACLSIEIGGVRVAFTGDVGRQADLLMLPPEPLPKCDVLVTESTYGDRLHADDDVLEQLAVLLRRGLERGGVVVIPAFAVGRAQLLMYAIGRLQQEQRVPNVPVYLDSPMASKATTAFAHHLDDHRLDHEEVREMCRHVRIAGTAEESKAIDTDAAPKIIISASGMATGGRVLHHLMRFLPDHKNMVIMVGFQAAGTRGRALVEGAAELKMYGEYVPVNAEVARLDGMSAHADYRELLAWLERSELSPRRVFVVHGEPTGADALRRRLGERFGWDALVPEDAQRFDLVTGALR